MACIIRLAGETDREYEKRCRPLQDAMLGMRSKLFQKQMLAVLENNIFLQHLTKIESLRRSCGVGPSGETFKWDVHP